MKTLRFHMKMVRYHMKTLRFHMKMVLYHMKTPCFHMKMVRHHMKTLRFHMKNDTLPNVFPPVSVSKSTIFKYSAAILKLFGARKNHK